MAFHAFHLSTVIFSLPSPLSFSFDSPPPLSLSLPLPLSIYLSISFSRPSPPLSVSTDKVICKVICNPSLPFQNTMCYWKKLNCSVCLHAYHCTMSLVSFQSSGSQSLAVACSPNQTKSELQFILHVRRAWLRDCRQVPTCCMHGECTSISFVIIANMKT